VPRQHRFFAAIYDSLAGMVEKKGLSDLRREVVGKARGRVVEVGAGTGLNFSHYSPDVTEVIATEPSQHMLKRARQKAAEASVPISLEQTPGERLPLEDESVDTVVCTLVLCTVPDPAATLAEMRRVLKPDGRYLFFEHVRAPDPKLARWQDRLEKPWGFVGAGCHPNRDTETHIERAGFVLEKIDRFMFRPTFPLTRPHIKCVATKTV
jgi:ubiquinone/menaquinone biosynthesis C-methylase UbiE